MADTIIDGGNPLLLIPNPGRKFSPRGRMLMLADVEDFETYWTKATQAGGAVWVDVVCPSDPEYALRLAKTFVIGPLRDRVNLLEDGVTARTPCHDTNQAKEVAGQINKRLRADSDAPTDIAFYVCHGNMTETQIRELCRAQGGGPIVTAKGLHAVTLDAGNAAIPVEMHHNEDGRLVGFSVGEVGKVELAHAKSEAAAAAEELAAARAEIQQLSAQLATAQERINTLVDKLGGADSDEGANEALKAELETVKAERKAARTEATKLQKQLGKVQKELEDVVKAAEKK